MKTPKYSHFYDEVWEEKGPAWKEVMGMVFIALLIGIFTILMVALSQ